MRTGSASTRPCTTPTRWRPTPSSRGPAILEAGGRFLARGLPEATFEHGEKTRTVVIEFPSVEAAVAAHDSEGYQAALRALGDGADRDLRVVPGWEG